VHQNWYRISFTSSHAAFSDVMIFWALVWDDTENPHYEPNRQYWIHVYVKLIRYQFWCTRCAFRLLKSLQWYSGRKSWKSEKKNCENCVRAEKTKYCNMYMYSLYRNVWLVCKASQNIVLYIELSAGTSMKQVWNNPAPLTFKEWQK
jgi:hypothetical protein